MESLIFDPQQAEGEQWWKVWLATITDGSERYSKGELSGMDYAQSVLAQWQRNPKFPPRIKGPVRHLDTYVSTLSRYCQAFAEAVIEHKADQGGRHTNPNKVRWRYRNLLSFSKARPVSLHKGETHAYMVGGEASVLGDDGYHYSRSMCGQMMRTYTISELPSCTGCILAMQKLKSMGGVSKKVHRKIYKDTVVHDLPCLTCGARRGEDCVSDERYPLTVGHPVHSSRTYPMILAPCSVCGAGPQQYCTQDGRMVQTPCEGRKSIHDVAVESVQDGKCVFCRTLVKVVEVPLLAE